MSDDVEVIEMTPEEYEAAKARALAELGLTYEDKALISAVGEKYTGSRGASGTAVGTAADWFARMIGLEKA